jgi:aminoglycoside phosphotransferase (APT) family kinase protein
MSDVIVAPETRDPDTLKRQLARWIVRRIPGVTGIRIENVGYPRGAGQSHETVLFDLHWREGGDERSLGCVLRIKPGRFTVFPDTLFEQQYRIMKLLSDGGYVRVARPLWFEEDPSVLGAPFFIMEKVVGRVPVSVPPYAETGWVAEATPAQRRRMWEGGVRQLAAVQSVPLSEVQFLAGPDGARDGLAQEFDKYTRFVAWVQEDRPWPVLEAGLARLRDLWPANQPPGLVWGDARLGNMMFNDDFEVVAVMDWEQPSLGGALNDLAWWLVLSETMHGATPTRPHLAGMGTREETIALWEELTGKSAADVEWYEDFTRLKMSCTGVRLQALRGAPPPDEAWLAKRLKVDAARTTA